MKLKYKCGCMSDSPFMWKHDKHPSIFMSDPLFKASKDGKSLSQKSTELVDEIRKKNGTAGFLRGISKKREEEMLRVRNFMIYSMAKTKDGK